MLRPWAALFVLMLGCSPKVYSIAQEGHHHFAYKSDRVTVWDVTVPAHTSTRMHAHDHDYLFVTIGSAMVTSIPLEGQSNQLLLHDGEVRFTKAPLIHMARDDGDQTFHNVTIELAQPATNVTPCDLPCVFTSSQWTVYRMTLAPGEHIDTLNALIVPLTPVDLTRPTGEPLRLSPGMVNDTHSPLTNAGSASARLVLLEYK